MLIKQNITKINIKNSLSKSIQTAFEQKDKAIFINLIKELSKK